MPWLAVLTLVWARAPSPSMEGVAINGVSSSGKSLILDLGSVEGLKIGQLAKFYYPYRGSRNSYLLAAQGEIVKLERHTSFWFLRRGPFGPGIKKGGRLLMIRQTTRRPYTHRHVQQVLGERQSEDQIEFQKNVGVPKSLVLAELSDTLDSAVVETPVLPWHHDGQTEELTRWKRQGFEEYDEEYQVARPIFFVETARFPRQVSALKKEREREVWESTLGGVMAKAERFPAGYYASPDNVVSPGAVDRMNSEGPRFSGDIGEEQLRHFFIRSGIKEEINRQKGALSRKNGHEVRFSHQLGPNGSAGGFDRRYWGSSYHWSAGYDFHLLRLDEKLQAFSLGGQFEFGSAFYGLGDTSAYFTERSFRFHMQFYPWAPPDSIKRWMPYAGVSWRNGITKAYNDQFQKSDKEYAYFFGSFPNFQAGVKYRFKAGDTKSEALKVGVGIDFQIQYEVLRAYSAEHFQDDILKSFRHGQFKLGLGLSFYL